MQYRCRSNNAFCAQWCYQCRCLLMCLPRLMKSCLEPNQVLGPKMATERRADWKFTFWLWYVFSQLKSLQKQRNESRSKKVVYKWRDLKTRSKWLLLTSIKSKKTSLSQRAYMHSMHSKNCDLVDAWGQNGLEKQAVEKHYSRILLLASCVITMTARADCDDEDS